MAIRPPKEFLPLSPDVAVTRLPAAAARIGGAAVSRIAPELLATIITFDRPEGLQRLVTSLAEQTILPERVVVIDNGGDAGTAGRLRGLATAGSDVVLLTPPENVGPAGATALAMTIAFDEAFPQAQWLTILNDDLVFSHPAILEEMLAFAKARVVGDPAVGAVGRIGHRFDRAWARLRRPPEADLPVLPQIVEVDYLTTGAAREGVGQPVPMFRLEAVREAGPFWADLFIGMTEVEFGLRLRRSGFKLLANGSMWRQPRPDGVAQDAGGASVERTPRRRYYSARNLVVIARIYGGWWTPAWVTVSRLAARGLALLRRPGRSAWAHLQATLLGLGDGWRSRLGERRV